MIDVIILNWEADRYGVTIIRRRSYGEVFLCRNKDDHRYYAMKKIRVMEMDPSALANIKNELKLLQKLRHNNIVSFKDSFTNSKGEFCIVLVFCEGGDMSGKIRVTKERGKSFHEAQVLDWTVEIVQLSLYSVWQSTTFMSGEYCIGT